MKKFSLLLVILSFFAFVSLNSCNQAPKEADATEEAAPAEEMEAEEEVTEEAAPAEEMEAEEAAPAKEAAE